MLKLDSAPAMRTRPESNPVPPIRSPWMVTVPMLGAPILPLSVPKPPATDPAGSSRIKRMVSRTDVVLTRGIERATGKSAEFDAASDRATLLGSVVITSGPDRQANSDRADMDNKSDTALLTGNVVVTQVKNVLKGRRLFLDRLLCDDGRGDR